MALSNSKGAVQVKIDCREESIMLLRGIIWEEYHEYEINKVTDS